MFKRAKDKLDRSLGNGGRTGGGKPSLIDQLESAIPSGLLSLRRGRRSYYDDRGLDDAFDFDNDDDPDEDEDE